MLLTPYNNEQNSRLSSRELRGVIGWIRISRDTIDVDRAAELQNKLPENSYELANIFLGGVTLDQCCFHRLGINERKNQLPADFFAESLDSYDRCQKLDHADLRLPRDHLYMICWDTPDENCLGTASLVNITLPIISEDRSFGFELGADPSVKITSTSDFLGPSWEEAEKVHASRASATCKESRSEPAKDLWKTSFGNTVDQIMP